MKTFLTIIFALVGYNAFAQVLQTSAGKVDLENDTHYGGYLQSKSNPSDKSKIIWYPDVSLYRLCAKYDKLQVVPVGYKYVDVDCNCAEAFPYKLGPCISRI